MKIHDARLKLETVGDRMRMATETDKKAAAALLKVVQAKNKLDKVVQKRNELNDRLREV